MKILLDECLPKKLKSHLPRHEPITVQEMGWSGKSNGELLSLAEKEFAAFITVDQNLRYQLKLSGRRISVVVLMVRANKIDSLLPVVPRLLQALEKLRAGDVVLVEAPGDGG